MEGTLSHKTHKKASPAHANPRKPAGSPSSIPSQPAASPSASTAQPEAIGQSDAKRRSRHVSPTPQKRFKMGPSAISKAHKDPAEVRSQLLVRFYDPDIQAKDPQNGTLEEILSWPDSRLESEHNFIQVVFPLPERSMVNWDAPLIDLAVMQAFRSRSELRQQLRRSFERMLRFYGFQVSTKSEVELKKGQDEKKVASEESDSRPGSHKNVSVSDPLPYHVIRAPNWQEKFQNWAVPYDHNLRRITRILRSLRVLGLERECTAFFAALEHVFHDPEFKASRNFKISEETMRFWGLAVKRPLHWAPDDQKCKWLEAWEKEHESSEKSK